MCQLHSNTGCIFIHNEACLCRNISYKGFRPFTVVVVVSLCHSPNTLFLSNHHDFQINSFIIVIQSFQFNALVQQIVLQQTVGHTSG